MSTGAVLIALGVFCLAVCGFLFYRLMPQEGKPPSPWVGTDTRGTAVAMALMVLLLFGIGLLFKGIFS
jgi:hypothetical protein